jgi:integrase
MNPQTSFESPLADMMERFVVHKQMQGFDYTDPAYRLTFFDRLLCSKDCSDGLLRSEHFSGYLESMAHLKLKTRESRLGVVHQFSLYLNAFRPDSQVMPLRRLPAVEQSIRFHRITAAEVGALMDAATKLSPKIRAACIRFLIGLLYATGLRISEAINLNLGDIDLERSTLFVRRGKFGKDRLIALAPSSVEALNTWLGLRSFHAGNGNSSPLLVGAPNKRLSYPQAKRAFRKLRTQCGLHGDPPPRLHDLRHNYASECLARWRREGKDIQTLLPVLSAAMGHVNPRATQCYIHIDAATLLDASGKIRDRFIQPNGKNQ